MNDLTLEITTEDAANYLELATASDKTLEQVQSGFRGVLRENLEHPFRQTLTPMLEELLGYLAELPEIDCNALPKDAHKVVKGWLIHHGVMLALISGYYAGMSEEEKTLDLELIRETTNEIEADTQEILQAAETLPEEQVQGIIAKAELLQKTAIDIQANLDDFSSKG